MEIKKTFIPLIKGVDLSMRKLPLMQVLSHKPGPTIWLTAAIHGDEVTGTAIIHSLMSKLSTYPLLSGTIYAIPILNPAGFETISHHEPFGETNLNRQFPGDPHGSPSERQAYIIAQTIIKTKPDYVIDLHTDSINSIAYSIVDQVGQDLETLKKSITMTQTLGFPWAMDRTFPGYNPENTLTGYLMQTGIPAVTIELGGPMFVQEYFRKKGVEAIWRFFQALNVVPAKSEVQLQSETPSIINVFEKRIESDSTGIIDYRIRPGESFKAGQIMGKIRNVYGKEIEIIRAPSDGILFSHEDQSIAFPGQTSFTYVTSKVTAEIIPSLVER